MINEAVLAVLLGYGVFTWSVVEKAKPTLRKRLIAWGKDTPEWQALVYQIAAFVVVLFLLLADPETRVFAIIGKSPGNVVWQVVDLLISCTIAFQSNEAAHRLIDLVRLGVARKELSMLDGITLPDEEDADEG